MRVLIVANAGFNLYNYRMPVARALRDRGVDVVMVCPPSPYTDRLTSEGFPVRDWRLSRSSLNPVQELSALRSLVRIYRREQPGLVHHFTVKPILYGTMAARRAGVPAIANTWTGMGFLFTSARKARLMRSLVLPLMRLTLRSKNSASVFHNRQDMDTAVRFRVADAERAYVLPGSGVDTATFAPGAQEPRDIPTVLMAARLLWDKGLAEFVEAASMIHGEGVAANFLVAGEPDPSNPSAIPERVLGEWRARGVVNFLGYRDDMPDLLRQSDVAVLPSYHEGFPRFLLEAGATGLPLVAADNAGCRMIVRDGVNGAVVPVADSARLAEEIKRLIADPGLRTRYGEASRRMALAEFSEQRIVEAHFDLYEKLGALSSGGRADR